MILGQPPVFGPCTQLEHVTVKAQLMVSWNYINMIRLEAQPVANGYNGQAAMPAQNMRELTLVIQPVINDDKSYRAIRRNRF